MSEYRIKEVPKKEFAKLTEKPFDRFFKDDTQIFRLRNAISKSELEKIELLEKNMGNPISIYLGLFYNDEFVGWSWGFQESGYRFYMCNSAVFPEHRRKGQYSKLMNEMIKRATKHGFQEIYSRHTITNNAVLIPKLKAGFVITSMEMSDLFGGLVNLSYYPNKLRNKVLNYRIGETKPDDEIKNLFNL